ncbi:MAG: SoxR reducing system RseC family protein [Desulfobacterales bacterium]|nr:SoxR reducing system RseC family protein [Desulfobacterales bacterium]
MAREEGIVIEVGDDTVTVKTTRSASCEGCASQGSCMAQGDDMEVQVQNNAGARVGDRVVIEFETASLIKATFLLYIFPVICLLVGALIGNVAGERLGINPSGLSAALAFFLFFASFALVKFGSNRMAGKDAYRPKIVRVSKSAASVSSAPSSVPS